MSYFYVGPIPSLNIILMLTTYKIKHIIKDNISAIKSLTTFLFLLTFQTIKNIISGDKSTKINNICANESNLINFSIYPSNTQKHHQYLQKHPLLALNQE